MKQKKTAKTATPAFESFTVTYPAKVALYLKFCAAEDGVTPERLLAESGVEAMGAILDTVDGRCVEGLLR